MPATSISQNPGPPSALPPGPPDAQRLQSQLASLVEKGGDAPTADLRPVLEFLRSLLQASAVALLPLGNEPGAVACVVTICGVTAGSLAQIVAPLDPHAALALPAPALGTDAYTLAVPVVREAQPRHWLIAQLTVANPRDLQAFLVLLQALAGFILSRDARRATEEAHWALERTSGLLEIFRRAGGEQDFPKACRIAADDLRGYLGCSRVFLATRQRGGLHLRAISGVTKMDAKSPSHAPFEAAMREAIAAGTRIDFRADSTKSDDTAAHEILQAQGGAAQITTIPFANRGGAVLLEWTGAAPDARAAALLAATAPFVPAIFDLLERARPHPAVFAARRGWARLGANRRRAALAGAALLAGLLAFPFHDGIKADCRLAPTVKRTVAAPFQGQLKKSFVQPGDHVEAGAALAEMDNRELKLKEAELTAARERALKQRDKALANVGEGADFPAAQVANFEAQSVGRELELVQRKIALLAVQAPISGTIVSGDLRRAEGLPVQQGQVLFEIAPLDKMIVEMDVPDREISRVRDGLPVRFRLEAFGGERWHTRLDRLHPQSEQRDGHNVFVCEAAVENANRSLDLRPGMRGRAVIEGDRRPLLWILGHRLWEFAAESLFW